MKALALGPGGHSFTIDDELLMPYRRALCEGEPKAPARLVFAAAHVVMKPEYRELSHSTEHPGSSDEIATHVDWKTTMAVRAHLDLGADVFYPVHWATFNLAYHEWSEPIERTLSAAAETGVKVVTPRVGERFDFDTPFSSKRWWVKF